MVFDITQQIMGVMATILGIAQNIRESHKMILQFI